MYLTVDLFVFGYLNTLVIDRIPHATLVQDLHHYTKTQSNTTLNNIK